YTNATTSGTISASYQGSGANTIKVSNISNLAAVAKNRDFTVNIAVFGKYLGGDDAKITVELNKNSDFRDYKAANFNNTAAIEAMSGKGISGLQYIVVGDYLVLKIEKPTFTTSYEYAYVFFDLNEKNDVYTLDKALFTIYTDSKFRGKAVSFLEKDSVNGQTTIAGEKYHEFFATLRHDGNPIFSVPQGYAPSGSGNMLTSESTGADRTAYRNLVNTYEDDFVEGWSFDLSAENNYVKPAYFESALKVDNLADEVFISPYEAPVIVVPPVIIENPPKVG
ncbi:hypothetical protein LJC27_08510, partial [Christensenellaceae bacterium OttesenSCG-928-M15]|nr:hypothetical protein [Christensenellaceae bacterium OttesenSCG-928-M15]